MMPFCGGRGRPSGAGRERLASWKGAERVTSIRLRRRSLVTVGGVAHILRQAHQRERPVNLQRSSAKQPATYQDVLDAPPNKVAEIIRGALHLQPRPAMPHAFAGSALGVKIGGPFQFDGDGPGGWWIVDEPELHLAEEIVVPDLAGWRRERMPRFPRTAYVTLAPDWVCEILSPSTRALDVGPKRAIYLSTAEQNRATGRRKTRPLRGMGGRLPGAAASQQRSSDSWRLTGRLGPSGPSLRGLDQVGAEGLRVRLCASL